MAGTVVEPFPLRQSHPILSEEEIEEKLSRRFREPGLSHMKIANVTALGARIARAEVVTRSGSVVLVIEVDRFSGDIIGYW